MWLPMFAHIAHHERSGRQYGKGSTLENIRSLLWWRECKLEQKDIGTCRSAKDVRRMWNAGIIWDLQRLRSTTQARVSATSLSYIGTNTTMFKFYIMLFIHRVIASFL